MEQTLNEKKKKRGGDNGKRKPIIDEYGDKWCNCTVPKLVSNAGTPNAKGQAYCLKCNCFWYH